MSSARKHSDKLSESHAGRPNEIDELENEIIQNYINSDEVKLSQNPEPIQIQVVLANSQRMLSRVSEIHNYSIKSHAKLCAIRQMLLDAILPLMTGGSADSREAKARSCTEFITYLIALEEGLIAICESTQKNLKSVQEMASRQLKCVELDITYFNGAETLKNIVAASRKKNFNA